MIRNFHGDSTKLRLTTDGLADKVRLPGGTLHREGLSDGKPLGSMLLGALSLDEVGKSVVGVG